MNVLYCKTVKYLRFCLCIVILDLLSGHQCDYVPLLPAAWPCQWNDGVIPYVFDFYITNAKRVINIVQDGLWYFEKRSCLRFEEQSPQEAANRTNYTYLYFTFANVLEDCCSVFFNKEVGRRVVRLTPVCTLPSYVSHAILHGLGLAHKKKGAFDERFVRQVVGDKDCKNSEMTVTMPEGNLPEKENLSTEY